MQRVRSLYYAPSSKPDYISCDSALDWDAFAKEVKAPQTEGYQQGLELLKGMKTVFVTRNALKTQVTVTGDSTLVKQKKTIQQQITAFFNAYWMLSDGRPLPGVDQTYQVAPTSYGYVITPRWDDGSAGTIQMDSSFLVTSIHAVQGPRELIFTPKFERQNDGLLHLVGVTIDSRLGESRLLYTYDFDYQQASGFYVPQHVTMSMPGALSFMHTFSSCHVFDKANAPVTSSPEIRP